jgi:hypothetical protein
MQIAASTDGAGSVDTPSTLTLPGALASAADGTGLPFAPHAVLRLADALGSPVAASTFRRTHAAAPAAGPRPAAEPVVASFAVMPFDALAFATPFAVGTPLAQSELSRAFVGRTTRSTRRQITAFATAPARTLVRVRPSSTATDALTPCVASAIAVRVELALGSVTLVLTLVAFAPGADRDIVAVVPPLPVETFERSGDVIAAEPAEAVVDGALAPAVVPVVAAVTDGAPRVAVVPVTDAEASVAPPTVEPSEEIVAEPTVASTPGSASATAGAAQESAAASTRLTAARVVLSIDGLLFSLSVMPDVRQRDRHGRSMGGKQRSSNTLRREQTRRRRTWWTARRITSRGARTWSFTER